MADGFENTDIQDFILIGYQPKEGIKL